MRLAYAHTKLQMLELVRFPGFSVATLAFPSLFFVLFGLPRAHGLADQMLASYAAFAVLGVGFFQFGVAAAIERDTPWNVYVRTLPVPPSARIAGRVLAALAFATAAAALVVIVVLCTTSAALGTTAWLRLAVTLLFGSVPFVVLGVVIAYWTSPKSALPAANVLYLLLSYAGGLWTGPSDLPHAVTRISRYTPTRQWGDLLWASAAGQGWGATHWLALAGYTCAFGVLAAWGYRRDEGKRFT
jgi:ABC-2 type transport system permease protein